MGNTSARTGAVRGFEHPVASAVTGLPPTIPAAWMYGVLGSRRTVIAYCVPTAGTPIGFAVARDSPVHDRLPLSVPPALKIPAFWRIGAETKGRTLEGRTLEGFAGEQLLGRPV